VKRACKDGLNCNRRSGVRRSASSETKN